jgi:hypothetical protein
MGRELKAKEFRWVFLALLAPLLFLGFSPGSKWTIGASAEWSNGNYTFAGGTHPGALLLSGITIVLYLWLLRSKVSAGAPTTQAFFRRPVAALIDFVLAIVATAPIFGIVPMLAEWRQTGSFAWNLERTTYFAGDKYVIGATSLLAIAMLMTYFALPLLLGKPSPGACILGYQIVPDDGFEMTPLIALGRGALDFVSLCEIYGTLFGILKRKRGSYWVDRFFHTHAIQLK